MVSDEGAFHLGLGLGVPFEHPQEVRHLRPEAALESGLESQGFLAEFQAFLVPALAFAEHGHEPVSVVGRGGDLNGLRECGPGLCQGLRGPVRPIGHAEAARFPTRGIPGAA